jgi:hypothetical protein
VRVREPEPEPEPEPGWWFRFFFRRRSPGRGLAPLAQEKQPKAGDVGAIGSAVCSRDPITYARKTAISARGEGEGRWQLGAARCRM